MSPILLEVKGLTERIKDAFVESTLASDPGTTEHGGGDTTKIEKLAVDLANAIVDWVTSQTFTITEMKASLELENLNVIAPGVISSAGPPGATLSLPFALAKGAMVATGHAYVGMPATTVPGGDTQEQWNTFTKVKLDPNKVKKK